MYKLLYFIHDFNLYTNCFMFKKTNLRILIIEDEPASAFILRRMLFDLSYNDVNIYSDAKSGMEALKIIKPDILFLDIYLNHEQNGIDVLKYIDAIQMHTHVIITSGHDKFIKDVVRYSIIDFLLKPISKEELRLAVDKVVRHNHLHQNILADNNALLEWPLVEINSNKEINYYQPQNVVYIEADGNYSHIFLVDGKKETVSQNLGKLAGKFSSGYFTRVSRKSIVNIQFLKRLNKITGELELEYFGLNHKINTSKKYFQYKHE